VQDVNPGLTRVRIGEGRRQKKKGKQP
jgi:hypothetical protein